MKKSSLIRLISLVLVVAMAVLLPVQTYAVNNVMYISDIEIGYGDDGKAALEAAGYTVFTNLNANEGGNGSAVWLGYLTTLDPNEAITDLAVMNMSGGYSFDAYTEELEMLNRNVSEQLSSFAAAIAEFRSNYASGNRFALYAKDLMNQFYDEDVTDETGAPRGIGDILLDTATSDDTLHMIFLEGNTEALYAIEQGLAIACTEVGENNLLSRLEELEYTDELSPLRTKARSTLTDVFSNFHSDALAAVHANDVVSAYESLDAYLVANDATNAATLLISQQYLWYLTLSSTAFGDTGMTLLDFALLDTVNENDDGWVLDDDVVDMLARAMTDGQLGIVSNVGLMTVVANAASGAKGDGAASDLETLLRVHKAEERISVFYGVDRSLFTDTDSIALTSAAMMEKAATQGNNFGKDSGADKTGAIAMSAAAGVALISGVALTSYFGKILSVTLNDTLSDMMVEAAEIAEAAAEAAEAVGENVARSAASVAGKIGLAIGIIAIVAFIVLTIFSLLKWIEKPETVEVKYTKIPRVLVDKRTEGDSTYYVNYYAAKLVNPSEGATDSTQLYGDLNGMNKIDPEWFVLYYTKNPKAGTPLTDEMILQDKNVLTTSKASYYQSIHLFSSSVAVDLNQYSTSSSKAAIYVFFRTAKGMPGYEGSVFSNGVILPSLAAFVVGGGLCTLITYAVMKKKAKKETVAER